MTDAIRKFMETKIFRAANDSKSYLHLESATYVESTLDAELASN